MKRKVSTIWTEEEMLNLRYLLPDSAQARIDGRRGSPDPEYRDVWPTLTPGERIFLMVFWSAFRLRYLDKLVALYRGDVARAEAVQAQLRSDYVVERRGLERVTPAMRAQDARDRNTKRQSDSTQRRHHGWLRDDVAAEALNRDLEPLLGPPRCDPVWLPERDLPPSPVRQVSIEEYERTKQQPKKGDAHLSFLPKAIVKKSDKYYEGSDIESVDWYEPDPRSTMAGYDDPRHEDGPHNPRYSPE